MLGNLYTIPGWTQAIGYIADIASSDGTGATTSKLVAALNTLPLSTRTHIRAIAAAITSGVSST